MDHAQLQAEVRRAITQADELSRRAHVERLDAFAQGFDGLRTAFARVEEALGGGRSPKPVLPDVVRVLDELAAFQEALGDAVARELRLGFARAIQRSRALVGKLGGRGAVLLGYGRRSRPVLGLPLARLVPHDVHALFGYATAGAWIGSASLARTTRGRVVGAALGAAYATIAATTDQRLALVRLAPIESKVVLDPLLGLTAMAAPFLFGYARRDPGVAAVHVLAGAATLVSSLLTDYRAAVES